MSWLSNITGGNKSETPSTSETAVGANNLVPKDSQPAVEVKAQSASDQSSSMSSSKPGSAEAAAEVRLSSAHFNEQKLILLPEALRRADGGRVCQVRRRGLGRRCESAHTTLIIASYYGKMVDCGLSVVRHVSLKGHSARKDDDRQ